jgi:hypothetical protein
MQYRTKVIINGAEILDEQSDTASSITNVKLTESCGQGFQIGSTASSSLSFTMLKPYKESFDGDKVGLYILQANAEDEATSLREELEEEVGGSTETLAISDDSTTAEVETVETVDPDEEEAEDMTDEEVAEAEAEWNELGESLYEFMNGEEVTDEDTGTEIEEAAISWECIGAFYVYSQTNNTDGSVTLQCYDGFNLLNGSYTPSQGTGTFQEFYNDLRTQCATLGVTVDEEDFTEGYNPTLTWNQVCSYRTAFGYLAGLQGGFGTFDGDSTLGISYYGYSDELFLVPDLLSYSLTSAGETEIDGIICTINLNQDTVEAGDGGQPLKFYNPFVTQEQADSILSQYRGVRYYGANIKAKWNSDLLAGDLIRVMTSDEYKNYVAMMNAMANASSMTASEVLELKKQINAVGKSVLISSQTISFSSGGEAIAEITSYLQSETEKTNAPASPSDAKFRTLAADLIKTKELIADKATITDLEATNANVDNLTAKTSTLETAVAEKATIDDLTAATGRITTLETDSATMKEAIAGKVTADEVAAKYATIENLNTTNATVAEIDANTVKTSELDAKVATITEAEIKKATIDGAQISDASIESAKIKSINGNLILDGSIIAAALSQEAVKNFNNNNIYYQAEAPTGDLKEGDLWFKTVTKTSGDSAGILYVYSGGAWATKPFDAESILAKSITAGQIASGTITAGEIDMNTMQAAIAYIGALDGKHVQIESDSVKVKDGTTVLAEFGENIKLSSDKDQYIGGDDARIYFNHTDGTLTITGSKITIGAVDDVASDLQEAVDGTLYYQYTTGGVTYDVTMKSDGKYYYTADDGTETEVQEADLDTDDDGTLTTVRKNGLNSAIDDVSGAVESLEDVVTGNKADAEDCLKELEASLAVTDKKAAANADSVSALSTQMAAATSYIAEIKGAVKITDGIVVGSESGSNIQITDESINLRYQGANMATIEQDAIRIPTADVTYLRLGSYILEATSDGSLTLKVR